MVTGHAHLQNSALHADRPHPPVISNKGVLHFWPFAKYAVAFPRMSRSIFTRANSARNRLISICSTLTALLLAGPFSLLSREFFAEIARYLTRVTYVDLSDLPGYMDEFVGASFLPHTSPACLRMG